MQSTDKRGVCACSRYTMLTYMQTLKAAAVVRSEVSISTLMTHSVFDSTALIDHLSPANLEWPPHLVTIRNISVCSHSVGLNAQLAGAQLGH